MRTVIRMTAAAAALASSVAAGAADGPLWTGDHNAGPELARGDYARAERVLAASLRVAPDAADLLLNQARLYALSGRAAAARPIYDRVLAQPDEAMVMADGRARSSHALARAGLATTAATRLAER